MSSCIVGELAGQLCRFAISSAVIVWLRQICVMEQAAQEQYMDTGMDVPCDSCCRVPGGIMKPGGGATPGGGRSMCAGMPPGKGIGANCRGGPGPGCRG